MVISFKLLNSKEIKKINSFLKEQFGNEFNFSDYLVYKSSKNRIYIVNKEFSKMNLITIPKYPP
jgi:hypothetical protein